MPNSAHKSFAGRLREGIVSIRVWELNNELRAFLQHERNPFYRHLDENDWCSKLDYLADIFSHLNVLNASMEGHDDDALTDKQIALDKSKLQIWFGRDM